MLNKIFIIGIGPGSADYLTPQAKEAIECAEVIVGYKYYLELISELITQKELVSNGMKKERERAERAFQLAEEGKTVAMISSGDAGIYGMASLLWEMKANTNSNIELEVVPGISAMLAAAAKLGAPISHDMCTISLSDLLTPWQVIEKRIIAAASADFITAIYNPVSNDRFWQLMRLKELFLQHKSPDTPVGIARQVGRDDESIETIKLKDLDAGMADMFTLIIIGNEHSFEHQGNIVTPRGYYKKAKKSEDNPGRQIMNKSFQTILEQLDQNKYSLEELWVILHCIHTTADFSLADCINVKKDSVANLHKALFSENPPVIVTDVRMVTDGIRRALVDKLGLQVKCYLNDERTATLAEEQGITRTQAGIRLAVKEHPNALFAFGNAPTALMELSKQIRNGHAHPTGIVAAPVGFVNVEESKWRIKYGNNETPHIIVEGKKGGSNVAATIINSVLSWAEAENMHPGEGV